MPVVLLESILPALQTLKAVLSTQGDLITVNVTGKSLLLYAYDKAREIQVFGRFPEVSDGSGNLKFTISLERFRVLLQHQAKVHLEFGKTGLRYGAKGVSGSIEAGPGETIVYPDVEQYNAQVNKALYDWIKVVKLNTLFKKEDMLVFVRWDQSAEQILVSCADNFHTALLTSAYNSKKLKSFNIALPIRYVEIANRLMVDDGVAIAFQDDTTLFYNQNMVLKIPSVNVDAEQVNIDAIIEYTKTARGKRSALVAFDRPDKIKTFLGRAKALVEEDRDSKVQMHLKDGFLKLYTETKHGKIESLKKVDGEAKGQITVNTKALNDLVTKIPNDRRVRLSINDTALYMSYNTDNYSVQLTTTGTTDDS